MPQHHVNQAQIMQQNLQRIIKNQNYFSCFIQSTRHEDGPVNPFQKKLFDKNLRRSAISCGHYASTSSNDNQSGRIQQQANRLDSPRIHKNGLNSNCQNMDLQMQHIAKPLSLPRIESTHKVSLAQSRHSDPSKQQITQIINNFRLQLDYLEEKLHNKIDQLNCKYNHSSQKKQKQAGFMIESLEKIVGFMVENCVNLEDSVMYGNGEEEDSTRQNRDIMRREVYQIEEDSNEQNMSFNNSCDQYKPTQRPTNNRTNTEEQIKRKGKILASIDKQNNINSNNNHDEQNLPQTYFINNKLHYHDNKPQLKSQHQTSRNPNDNSSSSKPTNRASSKSRNTKTTVPNSHNNNQYHYHSGKQNLPNNSHNFHHSCLPQNSHQAKSIYETVLEEREMRLKMKKRIV